ncbi:MAG: 4-hydroxythreonine-4-phosphate dehydrogenase PdxA [Bacteroidota bacterium]
MKEAAKIKVGISIGDLNGIGPEIVLKTFEDSRMLELCTPVIFANTKMLSFFKKHFNLSLKINGIPHASKAVDGKINVVNAWKSNFKIAFGEEDKVAGKYAFRSIEVATRALIEKDVDVLVTAPINKNSIQSEDFNFPGHTDYFAEKLKGDNMMFMVSESIRVGLLTDHVPVKDVAQHITPELIQKKVQIMNASLRKDFKIRRPKIAVLGINPHSGDNGVIGDEDQRVLKPAIHKINDLEGEIVYGPYAADSFFGSKNHENFDAVLAAYHDQGLIPFKTLAFGKGVNYTAGMNRIRTSPDHGTAFDIAGKNQADHSSFTEAVYTAMEIFRNRMEYIELTKNPLETDKKSIKK